MRQAARRRDPFVVTAYSMCNGLGRSATEVTAKLRAGTRGLQECPLTVPFDTVCGVVSDPLPQLPTTLREYDARMVRLGLLGLEGVRDALDRAVVRWGRDRVGMLIGTSTGGIAETEQALDVWRNDGRFPPQYDFETQHQFFAFTHALSLVTGIRGPCYVVSTACSASAKVVASAERLLQAGLADAVLVGGVDTLCHTTIRGFHSLGVLSPTPCRPFCADRQGMNVGEGAAFLLLERTGDGVAVLLGAGESSDAHHMSAPDPEGRGAVLAMERALHQAGLAAEDVDYVNAHGTGTKRNDLAEAKAIWSIFGDAVPVVSTKGYTGHLLGAGGATEAVFVLVAIDQGWIPGNIDVKPIDPEIRAHIPHASLDRPVRVALSNSFAFGGNNVCLAFGAPS